MGILEKFIESTAGNRSDDSKASVLQQLRDSGKSVTVRLEGDPRPYSGAVTAFQESEMVFVLGNLCPTPPAEKLPEGCMAAILASDRQRTVSFTCRCLGPLVPEQSVGYMMKLGSSYEVIELETNVDCRFKRGNSAGATISNRKAA